MYINSILAAMPQETTAKLPIKSLGNKKWSAIAVIAIIVAGAIAGAYYYASYVLPKGPAPTPSPTATNNGQTSSSPLPTSTISAAFSPSSMPTSSPAQSTGFTPTPTPASASTPTLAVTPTTPTYTPPPTAISSPSPTPSPSQTPSPTPSPSPSPTPTPTPAPWTITEVSAANTEENLTVSTGPGQGILAYPSSKDNIFLLVSFKLGTTGETTLKAQDILVVVSGIYEYHPNGEHYIVGDSMNGNITSESASLKVEQDFAVKIVDYQGNTGGSMSISFSVNSKNTLVFVYVLPRSYLDRSQSLQLKIAGSASGREFTVTPP